MCLFLFFYNCVLDTMAEFNYSCLDFVLTVSLTLLPSDIGLDTLTLLISTGAAPT